MRAPVREVVGILASRESFEAAVQALRDAGFEHADLSVLSTHESLEAAEGKSKRLSDILAALTAEYRYVGPLAASGAIFLAGGPIAATVAALVAAAVGGAALGEVVEEVTSVPDSSAFAKALESGGILLWVRADDPARQKQAEEILARFGARDIHLHQRPAS